MRGWNLGNYVSALNSQLSRALSTPWYLDLHLPLLPFPPRWAGWRSVPWRNWTGEILEADRDGWKQGGWMRAGTSMLFPCPVPWHQQPSSCSPRFFPWEIRPVQKKMPQIQNWQKCACPSLEILVHPIPWSSPANNSSSCLQRLQSAFRTVLFNRIGRPRIWVLLGKASTGKKGPKQTGKEKPYRRWTYCRKQEKKFFLLKKVKVSSEREREKLFHV